jgi:hypothetical protein
MGETAGVTTDVGSDPTVGLPLCLLCGNIVICEGRLQRDRSGAVDQSQKDSTIPMKERGLVVQSVSQESSC